MMGRSPGSSWVGATAWVYGWGTLSAGGSQPDALQEVQVEVQLFRCAGVLLQVEVPVVSNAECNSVSSYDGAITAQMLCAGEEGKDACQVLQSQ